MPPVVAAVERSGSGLHRPFFALDERTADCIGGRAPPNRHAYAHDSCTQTGTPHRAASARQPAVLVAVPSRPQGSQRRRELLWLSGSSREEFLQHFPESRNAAIFHVGACCIGIRLVGCCVTWLTTPRTSTANVIDRM